MIIASRSFGQRVSTRHELEEAVTTFAGRALACGRLAAFVTTDEHRPRDPQYAAERAYNLPVATADTGKLNRATLVALDSLWRGGFSYKKTGVMLIDLRPAATVQGGLFDRPDDERSQARMQALDKLNAKYGRGTVTYASMGRMPSWKLRTDSSREATRPDGTICWQSRSGMKGSRVRGLESALPSRFDDKAVPS